jgi:uncharacterized protein YukE
MAAEIIHADYDQLSRFIPHIEDYVQLTYALQSRIRNLMNRLQSSGWTGDHARAFFVEIDEVVLPAVRRLAGALESTSDATWLTIRTFQEAEEDAGLLFRGEEILLPGKILRAVGQAGEIFAKYDRTGNDPFGTSRGATGDLPPFMWRQANIGNRSQVEQEERIDEDFWTSVFARFLTLYVPNSYYSPSRIERVIPEGGSLIDVNQFVFLLSVAMANGSVHPDTMTNLLGAAYAGDRGASAALLGIILASTQFPVSVEPNAQGVNTLPSPFERITRVQSFVGIGGNCANFLSVLMIFSGFPVYVVQGSDGFINAGASWALGPIVDLNPASDVEVWGFEGTVLSRTVTSFREFFYNGTMIDDGRWGTSYTEYPLSDTTSIPTTIGPGDLVYSIHGEADPRNHVSMVVGWGPNIPDYEQSSGAAAPRLFVSYEDAYNYYSNLSPSVTITPWAVDHGGQNPQGYARPYVQTTTGGQIILADVGYPPLETNLPNAAFVDSEGNPILINP